MRSVVALDVDRDVAVDGLRLAVDDALVADRAALLVDADVVDETVVGPRLQKRFGRLIAQRRRHVEERLAEPERRLRAAVERRGRARRLDEAEGDARGPAAVRDDDRSAAGERRRAGGHGRVRDLDRHVDVARLAGIEREGCGVERHFLPRLRRDGQRERHSRRAAVGDAHRPRGRPRRQRRRVEAER